MVNLNKKRLLTLALLLFTFTSMLMAQTMKVTGSVVDQNGDPLIGVSVFQKGTSKGSVTDLDGKFAVETLKGATLEFSYIGFNTQDVKVNGESMNIRMKENSKVLDDVVVVGYGIQKKSSVTGAISQVKAGDLENRTITDANAALQGKTSGVQVISTTAAPGSTPTIRIRGYSSNVSSNPLYVVDGVRTTDISGIDPNDIASMEILKDAASAAIYGSEAGNGVILITTKKGKAGEGKISYDFQYTDQSVAHVPQVMNAEQYINYMTEAGTFTKNYLLKNWDGITNTNWSDVAFEHSPMVKHNLSFAGGSDQGNYYLSLSYLNNNGIVTGNNDYYHRLTATINAEHRFKEWIKVGTTNQIEKYDTRSVASNSEYGSVMTSVMTMDSLTPATYSANNLPYFMANAIANGKALLTDKNGNYYGISRFCSGEEYNPLIMTNNNNTRTSGFVVNGSIYADITPIKNLIFTSRFGYRLTGYRYSHASLPFYANGTQSNDYVGLSSTSSTTIYYQWENFANYMKSFHGHTITAMLGTSYQDQSYNYTTGNLTANGENVVAENNPLFYYLNYATASSVKGVAGETTRTAKLSYFGRLDYSYKDRYYAQFSLRADAADLSMLPHNTRWGYFPAASLGWTISEEKFFQPLKKVFDSVKFRASWGENGSLSALSNYSYSTDMISSGYYPLTSGNNYTSGVSPSTLGNDNLKWETSIQTDFGLDLYAFNTRLNFSADYFNKRTKDLLIWNTTPSLEIGGATSPINAGNISNKGFEFELGWHDHIGQFQYSIRGNLSTLTNKVTYIAPSITRVAGTTFHTYTVTYFEQGYPVYYFRGYKFKGIDKNTGNPTFKDLNGDGKITENDMTCIGDAIPNFTYGLTLTAAYKGFDLTVFGTGSHGNDIYCCINRPDMAAYNKLYSYFYKDRWTATNTNGTQPKAGANDMDKYAVSSAMVKNGSYFKIKQIQLGYTIPKKLLQHVLIGNLRVYISLDDYFTFTKYKGFDPEAAASTTSGMGVDKGTYPMSKKLVFGADIDF